MQFGLSEQTRQDLMDAMKLDLGKTKEFNETPTFRDWENTPSGSEFLHKNYEETCKTALGEDDLHEWQYNTHDPYYC